MNSYQPRNGSESIREYLFRVLNMRYKTVAPDFVLLLQKSIDQVLAQSKQCKSLTGYFDDRGRRFDSENEHFKKMNCAWTQIALRSPIEGTDQFKIEFDCDLFNRLGDSSDSITEKHPGLRFINQAILILHEAIYLIGGQLNNHSDSINVRSLTNELLSRTSPADTKAEFRAKLRRYGFDRYFTLIQSDQKNKETQELQQSYDQLVQVLGNLRRLFTDFSSIDGPLSDSIFLSHPLYGQGVYFLDPHSKPARLFYEGFIESAIPQLTTTEVFIYYASVVSDFQDLDFNALMAPGLKQVKIKNKVCHNEMLKVDPILDRALRPKVQAYCNH